MLEILESICNNLPLYNEVVYGVEYDETENYLDKERRLIMDLDMEDVIFFSYKAIFVRTNGYRKEILFETINRYMKIKDILK